MKAKYITFIAMMAALICVCSWISIPLTVPFTMQTFAVFITLLLLGGKNGTISIALYILLGIVGLPVFSGFQGGIGHILGPTGGYIVGFIFMGAIYMLGENFINGRPRILLLLAGLLICYLVGTLWFMAVGTDGKKLFEIAVICVFPYIVPDLAKLLLAYFICPRIKKYVAA